MALKAGRVGVAPDQVDDFGKVKSDATSGYTKQEADIKFETKTAASEALALKQPKTLKVPLEMLSGSKLTVEDALQGLNEEKFTYADNGVLGAKNLLPNNATSRTINGVTFTVNADGSVTANGTATADATFVIFEGTTPPFNGFVLNGCPSSGGLSKYFIGYNQKSSPFTTFGIDIGNGTIISIPSGHENDNYNIYIRIRNGITIENATFYPMIRRASDPDDTYVPYAMTNRELTENSLLKPFNNIISGIDLDNVVSSGFYVLGGDITHGAGNYGFLIVLTTSTSNTQVRQIFINLTEDAFFTRHKNEGTWSNWTKFTGTEVS